MAQRSREEKAEKDKQSYTTHSFDLEGVEKGKMIVSKMKTNATFVLTKGGVENRAIDWF